MDCCNGGERKQVSKEGETVKNGDGEIAEVVGGEEIGRDLTGQKSVKSGDKECWLEKSSPYLWLSPISIRPCERD